MNVLLTPKTPAVVYPESDGKPIADNTLQFRWIAMIQGNLDAIFRDRPDVFVASDLLCYPVDGDPGINFAPDVLVAFGRPKGDRGSYRYWDEGGVAPQVVFEILSPSNTPAEMLTKLGTYRAYGIEEYYVYDPDGRVVEGYQRRDDSLVPVTPIGTWVSPRLGIRFDWQPGQELALFKPNGDRFLTFPELTAAREQDREQARQAEQRAEQERLRAEQERLRAEQERQRAEQERLRAEKLTAQLRALGIEPEA
jgi:Uma2 family endonuclease